MATGETGYLGLQENMEEEIRQGNDVIANAAVPGKSQLLVFATPKAHGIYQGFEYDAIAIAYENSDIVDVLDISAFDGNAQSFYGFIRMAVLWWIILLMHGGTCIISSEF